MAASATTSTVYIQVIEDVVNKVREEFINNGGPGEAVLIELQGIWEMKMMQAGVILGPIDRSSSQKQAAGGPTPVHDLNVPYEGTEEYETPTAEMLFTPTPMLQTPLPAHTPLPGNAQTPLPGTADNSSMYNIPTGNSSEYPTPISETGGSNGHTETKPGHPSPYMQPPSPWMQQRPAIGVDVNVAYEESRDEADRRALNNPLTQFQDFFTNSSGKRKRDDFPPPYNSGGYIPQQDGAGDFIFEISQGGSGKIPQVDGPAPDQYDDDILSTPNIYNYQGAANEEYNVNTPATNELQATTPALVPQNDPDDDDEDEPLNEDDDDEEDLDEDDDREELNTQHLVLAQFDKVTRTKSRWKCTLKDGIMHINNKDILFNKANGEFDF